MNIKKKFFVSTIFSFLVMPLYFLPMDNSSSLKVVKTIPFPGCHHVTFLEDNALLLYSNDKYSSRVEVFDWKTSEKIEHSLCGYDLFSFAKDCWNRNILPWHGTSRELTGYDMQSRQLWKVALPEKARVIDFSDQKQDFLMLQEGGLYGDEAKIYLLNRNDNSIEFQEQISSILSKHNRVRLEYYNSVAQRAIYCIPGFSNDEIRVHDLKNNSTPIKKYTVECECRSGLLFISSDKTFAVYLVLHKAYFIHLVGEKGMFLLGNPAHKKYASVMIHPNNKYIFTMSCQDDSVIQVWDTTGTCILEQKSPTPDQDDKAQKARNYSAYWDAFSLSACRKYLAVAFPTQCVVYRLPFNLMYAPDVWNMFAYKLFVLKNCHHTKLPRDIVQLILKKYMYVSRWQEN